MKNESVWIVSNKISLAFSCSLGLRGNDAVIDVPVSSTFKNPVIIMREINGW